MADLKRSIATHQPRAILAAAWLAALLGVAYLVMRLRVQSVESMDFRYIWLAGKLWAEHLNPYGPDYIAAGAQHFPTGSRIAVWAYPFHWYGPAWLSSLWPVERAFTLWLIATTAAVAGAGWLAVAAARAVGVRVELPLALAFAGIMATSSAVLFALRNGQPAVLAECGIALCLFGVARGSRPWIVCGLVLAMLKPHLGLPFATALCFLPGGLATVAIAGLATVAACLPAFAASGAAEQLHGLLVVSRGSYQQASYNMPDMMPGLPHLVERLTPWTMSMTASMLVAAIATAGTAFALRRRPLPERKLLVMGLTCALTAVLVGLHPYDLFFILFTLPLLPALAPAARWMAIAGFALFWRAPGDPGLAATLETAAMLLILAAWVFQALRGDLRAGSSGPLEPAAAPGPAATMR